MGMKYSIGDRVVVVHRMKTNNYYSYEMNGSTGEIDKFDTNGDGKPIYHLSFDVAVFRTEGDIKEATKRLAWFDESCLDPDPAPAPVDIEEFESILD